MTFKCNLKTTAVTIFASLSLLAPHGEAGDWRKDQGAFDLAQTALLLAPTVSVPHLPNQTSIIEIDTEFMKEKLAEFSGATPVKIDGKTVVIKHRGIRNLQGKVDPEGRKLAVAFLKQEYESLGFQVSAQDFTEQYPGTNLIAEKLGQDPSKILVISAHLDSVGNAGANDDGTGIISALAVAKALIHNNYPITLRVVAFDQEENGLVGSHYYVMNRDKKEIFMADIHLEMMGTNSRKDGKFHVIDCKRPESVSITKTILDSIPIQNLALEQVPTCTQSSDHSSFWDADIPAVVVSENFFGGDGDKCYHKACDVFDSRIDFNYMSQITQAVAYGVDQILKSGKLDPQ